MLQIFPVAVLLACSGVGAGGQEIQEASQATDAKEAPRERYPFFTDAENRLILDYFRVGSGHLPPSVPKRESRTPPAALKALARGGILPVAFEKWIMPFPADLDRRLTTVPDGYRRLLHGSVAVLVQDSTRLIVDILDVSRR